jgi:mono/diheme cytochrome c family protein
MRHTSFRRVKLFFLATWTFYVFKNLIIPETGKDLLSALAFAASEKTTDVVGVYRQFCLKCHGANGKGDEYMRKDMPSLPDFTSEKWQKEIDDAQMLVGITDGKGTLMPPFGDKVNSDEVQALVEYIRNFDASRAK